MSEDRYDVSVDDQLEAQRRADLEWFADALDRRDAQVARLQAKIVNLHRLNGPSKQAGYWCSCLGAANLGGSTTTGLVFGRSLDYADQPAWRARAVAAHQAHIAAELEL